MKKLILIIIAIFSLNVAFGQDADSEIHTNPQPESVNISSLVNTANDAVEVFKLQLYDAGTADGLETKVTNIRLKPNLSNNTADWTDNIQGFIFGDGNDHITHTSTITDTYIDLSLNTGDLSIPDTGVKTLTFYVFLNTSNIEDGKVLSFMVDADNHGFTTDNTGSGFKATINSGNDILSNDFTIIVEATDLNFIQQPSDVAGNTTMSPDVTVAFTDVNGNIDVDYDGNGYGIGLTTTGSFASGSTTIIDPTVGIATFSNLLFDESGTNLTLTTDDVDGWGMINHTSTPFNVLASEIIVSGNNTEIVDGDTSPNYTNATNFGNVLETGSANKIITYTIENTGNIDLNLSGNPIIEITGTNASDFSVTQPAITTITSGANTTFDITFDPSATGVREATVSITNNDPNETPYNFTIQGMGYTPCTQLFISEYAQITGGNYIEIYNPSDVDVDMSNYQIWKGLNGGSWANAAVIQLGGAGNATDNLVPGNVFVLARDASEIMYANHYDTNLDFNGNDNIGLAYNDGNGYKLIDVIGNDQGDPGIGWAVAGVADATSNYSLVRKPSIKTGNTDWVSAAGIDSDSSEWTVLPYSPITQLHHVSGCREIPLMAVVGHLAGAGNDELVIDEGLAGDQTPKASNNTLFEDQQVGVTTVSHTFRIYNAGNTDLNLTGGTIVDITGANPNDFSVTTLPTSPVTAYTGYTDFIIEFNPTDYGVRTAVVSIPNDNPFENPYTFTIQGTGVNFLACNTVTSVTDQIIALQNFDGTAPIWIYTHDISYFDNEDNGFYGIKQTESPFTNANFDLNILYERDLNDDPANNKGTSGFATTQFNTIDISNAINVKLSFDYQIIGYNVANDVARYEVFYDNTSQGIVYLLDGSADEEDISGTININIPDNVNSVYLEISIRNNGADGYSGFDNFKIVGDIETPITTTWQYDAGTDTYSWSNGVPTNTIKAIIDADYDTATGNIEACACQVNTGATLTVNGGEHLLIETDFENNGIVEVLHEGSIVQHKNNATVSGGGSYKTSVVTTSMDDPRYTYFSSPTNGDTLDIFSSWAATTAMYTWDGDNDAWLAVASTDGMVAGKGYIVRPKNDGTISFPATFNTDFTGAFNNGIVTHLLYAEGDVDNAALVGNPYPSAIDADALLVANPGASTLYFWSHSISDSDDWSTEDYQELNLGGTTNGAPATISTGQGFFVGAAAAGTFTFDNKLRLTDGNNTFRNNATESELDKVWINVLANTNSRSQVLIGFNPICSDAYDYQYDAKRLDTDNTTLSLSSVGSDADTAKLAIQTRGSLTEGTVVPLTINIVDVNINSLTISIDHIENLVGWNVYVRDNLLNTLTNLNNGSYNFTTTSTGILENRFDLVFSRNALGITDNTVSTQLVVAQNSSSFDLSTTDETQIKSATLFNTLGQKIGDYKANNGELYIPTANINDGTVLFIKVSLDNGTTLTKKAIKL